MANRRRLDGDQQEQRRSEAQIVRQLRAGSKEAFTQLYRQHNTTMLRIATGILGSEAAGEETTHDAWIAVLNNIDRFEGRSGLAHWIYVILTNKARSRVERDGRAVSFEDDGTGEGLAAAFDGRGRWKAMPELWEERTPERIVAGRRLADHVAEAIDALPPAQRMVLILRVQQGLSSSDTAAILETSEANVRVMLHRARLALRQHLERLT